MRLKNLECGCLLVAFSSCLAAESLAQARDSPNGHLPYSYSEAPGTESQLFSAASESSRTPGSIEHGFTEEQLKVLRNDPSIKNPCQREN